MTETLSQILKRALREGWAVPHFNVSNLEQLKGIVLAAQKLGSPLMVGASEGERDFVGLREIVALIAAYRKDFNIPIFLNADHSKSVDSAKAAVDAGFDSVHIDLSKKGFEENLRGTKEVVAYARKMKPGISVEGELGYLVTDSSKVYKKKIMVDPSTFTKPDEAVKFVEETGVDRFAPAVGNLHGISANRPKLDYKLISELRNALPDRVAMVLHGGSGNSPLVFRKVIGLGFGNIHISTELRLAYARSLQKSVKDDAEEVAPYKIMSPVIAAVAKKAEEFIKIFKADGKA